MATRGVEDELDVVGCQLIHTEVLVAEGVVEVEELVVELGTTQTDHVEEVASGVFDDVEELVAETLLLDQPCHTCGVGVVVAEGVLELEVVIEVVLELDDVLDVVAGTHCEYAGADELDDDDELEVVEIA